MSGLALNHAYAIPPDAAGRRLHHLGAYLAGLIASGLLTNAVAGSARCGAAAVHPDLTSDRQRLLIMVVRDFALGAAAPPRAAGQRTAGQVAAWQEPPVHARRIAAWGGV
jgi:hypothetical protein